MKQYKKIIPSDKEKEILESVKEVILNHYPIVKNRLNILMTDYNEPETPEIEIHFSFFKSAEGDMTRIMFLNGTRNYKTSIPERFLVQGFVSKKLVITFLRYLLKDHDWLKNISQLNNRIEIPLGVVWRDDNMTGIGCGEIKIVLDFRGFSNQQLLKSYLKDILISFYDKAKNTPIFHQEFKRFCEITKKEFFESFTEEEVTDFFDLLTIAEKRKLLLEMSDELFLEVYKRYNASSLQLQMKREKS